MPLAEIFGANLRHHRKAKGLKQAELAELVDLSTGMISKIERGAAAPSFQRSSVCQVLNVPKVIFFGIGLIVTTDSDRTRIRSKIQTKLSRMNEDQLARADRLLAALVG